MHSLATYLFRLFCVKKAQPVSDLQAYHEHVFPRNLESTALYFQRLNHQVDVKGKTVLDVGCGTGATCIYVAQQGAREVLGIDIESGRLEFAQAKLTNEYSDLADRVSFKLITDIQQLGDRKFDIILSKDSFEHIANPQQHVQDLQAYVADDGILVIGFSPLWKSPWGGHMTYLTKLPWAHLLFPERVIMQERMRMFHPEDQAETFEQVDGGLNKMTLKKFTTILNESNLEPVYLKTNVHSRPLGKLFNVLRHIPGCKEYFTFNLYSIWRLKTPISLSSGKGRYRPPVPAIERSLETDAPSRR